MPNIVYTVAERVLIILQHSHGFNYQNIVDHFAAVFPHRPIPTKGTIAKIISKFRQTGIIDPKLNKVRQPKKRLSEETKLDILLKFEEDPSKPNSIIAKELNISETSVWKVLLAVRRQAKSKFVVSERPSLLNDAEGPMTFSQDMLGRLNLEEHLLNRLCFSNDLPVVRVAASNRKNARLWSRSDAKSLFQSRIEQQEALDVWLKRNGNRLIGSFFVHVRRKVCSLRIRLSTFNRTERHRPISMLIGNTWTSNFQVIGSMGAVRTSVRLPRRMYRRWNTPCGVI